ncbi:SulP family inorganic anion transporter [Pseudomonas turukhanskensis]|uniref:Sodium-independent anion transporter n=1 Tax=Pseudomonas turukhanskensis TaxID=1806536 RepID=A0A9W6K1X7_9PSED|nr:SulP family inorganic anion transporter [Pseudomonas turukhanskensis]GLK87272.1 sodium-independent anion transporter [Pseudomonas turukhanskensis]
MHWPARLKLFPFLAWLPAQTGRSVRRDFLVGLGGAVLALPQSIAYALIAGLPAEYGLYAAVVPVLVACLWGSSWHLICGPTAAISVVLFTSVSPLAVPGSADYVELVLLLTFLAGLFQWLLGLLRFGSLVNFVSHSVVVGFSAGAAVVIALGQLPYLLGIDLPSQATGYDSLVHLLALLPRFNPACLAVAAISLGSSLVIRKLWPRAPALLVGIVLGSLVVWALPTLFASVPRVAAFSGSLPPFSPLSLDPATVLRLLPTAVACGMLGLVTSLSISRTLASRSQQMLNANQEVRAQGLSNMVGAWFSGYLSAGSFTRSGLNLQSGASSPLAGVFSALLVAVFALCGAGLIAHIPLPSMAASILLICWGLIDFAGIRALYRVSRSEFVVMLLTLAATLLLELQTAIYAGVLASLFFYLKRTSQPRVQQWVDGDEEILRLEGSIFFGACHFVQLRLQRSTARRVVIEGQHMNFIDYAGVTMLHQEARRLRGLGRSLCLRNAKAQIVEELLKLEGPDQCPIEFQPPL